jgi:hypothetical protein
MNTLQKVKLLILVFIISLVGVGISVFPITTILDVLNPYLSSNYPESTLTHFLLSITNALNYNNQHYPFMLYTLDWLAYAHIMIALVFIGPLREPVKNIWVIEFGILACLLTLPAIFVFGYKSQIPLWWSCIDCSFGLIGALLLIYTKQLVKKLDSECAHTIRIGVA